MLFRRSFLRAALVALMAFAFLSSGVVYASGKCDPASCKAECKAQCKGDCKDKCSADCKDKCSAECKEKCKDQCKGKTECAKKCCESKGAGCPGHGKGKS